MIAVLGVTSFAGRHSAGCYFQPCRLPSTVHLEGTHHMNRITVKQHRSTTTTITLQAAPLSLYPHRPPHVPLTCRLSLCEEEEEEALLCVGVEVLWMGVALLSSALMVRGC